MKHWRNCAITAISSIFANSANSGNQSFSGNLRNHGNLAEVVDLDNFGTFGNLCSLGNLVNLGNLCSLANPGDLGNRGTFGNPGNLGYVVNLVKRGRFNNLDFLVVFAISAIAANLAIIEPPAILALSLFLAFSLIWQSCQSR